MIDAKKQKWFYLILILIPILFFVLLEGSLRIFNYGMDYRQWGPITKDKLVLNPDVAKRYFNTVKSLPYSIQDVFDREKKENSLRVFVLGGSSAAGYPFMPLGSFSRYIKQRFERVYPQSEIEIVNIAMTAVNSYTLLDLLPGVLDQDPDAIIIYAGHNEYYGALGVGSMESLGKSRAVVNLVLALQRFKTFELLKNFIKWGIETFGGHEVQTGTLMSRMAKEKTIPLNSEIYELGLKQFEGNMRDMFQKITDKNVPLLVGNLVSNLSGQPPFIANSDSGLPSGTKVFNRAKLALDEGNFKLADSLFRYAKDLDMLRFRASEKLNSIIKELSQEYNAAFVDVDSVFRDNSPNGIIGQSLMTDHLHPNLKGYQLLGKAFADKLDELKIQPRGMSIRYSQEAKDKITLKRFKFGKLDSVIADFRLKILKNDWPYVTGREKLPRKKLLPRRNFVDSLAYDFLDDKLTWEQCHRGLAQKYLEIGDINKYWFNMDLIITQYPILKNHIIILAQELIKHGKPDDAYKYLKMHYDIEPSAYTTKWMGIVALSHGNTKEAFERFEESIKLKSDDPQVYYNLAGAYVNDKNNEKALEIVREALKLDPNYAAAKNLKNQLEYVLSKK